MDFNPAYSLLVFWHLVGMYDIITRLDHISVWSFLKQTFALMGISFSVLDRWMKVQNLGFSCIEHFLAAARTNLFPAKAVFEWFMWFMSDANDCCACDSVRVNWGRESREPFPAHSLWACLHLVPSCVFSGWTSDREKIEVCTGSKLKPEPGPYPRSSDPTRPERHS